MGKAKKTLTRRTVGGTSPVGAAAAAAETATATAALVTRSDNVVAKLNSLDAQKRLAALIMLHDLLIQNQWRPEALTKLASQETLTALSVRLLDTNVDVMKQTVLCLTTMCRLEAAVADRVHAMGIDTTAVQLIASASTGGGGGGGDDTATCMLLELVHVVFTAASVASAKAMQGALAAMVLQHSARLRHDVAWAQFVCNLVLSQQRDDVGDGLGQLLHVGRLHDALKDVVQPSTCGPDAHVHTFLLAILLHVLTAHATSPPPPSPSSSSSLSSSLTTHGDSDDEVISTVFSMLIERVGIETAASNTTVPIMTTVRTASRAATRMCGILLDSRRRHPVLERLLRTYGNAGLVTGVLNHLKTALGSAGRYATAVARLALGTTTSDTALTDQLDVCEQLLHDVGECATWLASDPPPKLAVVFEGD